MSYLIFGDIDSRNYGVVVFEKNSYNAPHRKMSAQSVPGKNGDVLNDGGSYDNIDREFDCIVYANMYNQLANFRDAICSRIGYQRIETPIHPDEFFLGYLANETEIKTDSDAKLAKFKLTFNCKPQRFLKSGETVVTFEESGTIVNPTNQTSLPNLVIYGAGTVRIGDVSCIISAADEYTEIDCEAMVCKKGTTPKGQYVSFSQYEYPELKPGSNGISLGTGITKVEIMPRWYRL